MELEMEVHLQSRRSKILRLQICTNGPCKYMVFSFSFSENWPEGRTADFIATDTTHRELGINPISLFLFFFLPQFSHHSNKKKVNCG